MAVPLLLVAAVLLAANLLNNRFARSAYLVTSVVATVVLLAIFRGPGHRGWADAGLGGGALGRGVRWAVALVLIVAAGYLVAVLLPVTRGLLVDRRVEHAHAGSVAYQALVRIPLGTVLLEEVGFRGVLYGLLPNAVWATVVSSALFGLWHVLPSGELPELNPAAGRVFRPLVVPAAVVATALAGAVLCEVRRRSGSLLAPAGLHWAVNALGYVTAFLVTRSRQSNR